VFTTRYGLSPYIKQTRSVFKGLIFLPSHTVRGGSLIFDSDLHLTKIIKHYYPFRQEETLKTLTNIK